MAFKLKGSNLIKVEFQTEYMVNDAGARLAVSGSNPELGSWEVPESLTATESPQGSGKWRAALITTPQKQLSWKWVVISKDRSRAIRWENIGNREQTIGNESVILEAPWNEPALPKRYKSIHIAVDSDAVVKDALRAIENSDEDEFTKKKANLGDYNYKVVQRLAKEVVEQETKLSLALIDMIESGDEEGIEIQLSKLCNKKTLKQIRASLEPETFHMHITNADGVTVVHTLQGGKDALPPLQARLQVTSVTDVNNAQWRQWASILIEIIILVADCVGICITISPSRIESVSLKIAEMVKKYMGPIINNFLPLWKKCVTALDKARAIVDLLSNIYLLGSILWQIIKLLIEDMSLFEWFKAIIVLAATVIASICSGGIALIAKFVLALEGGFNFVHKFLTYEHLSHINDRLAA